MASYHLGQAVSLPEAAGTVDAVDGADLLVRKDGGEVVRVRHCPPPDLSTPEPEPVVEAKAISEPPNTKAHKAPEATK